MAIKLLTAADFKNAPSDPGEKFAYLEGICRERLYQVLDSTQSSALDVMISREYMQTVRAAAEALEIDGLPPQTNDTFADQFANFQLAVTGIVTKILVKGSGTGSRGSVRLSERSRKQIETKISLLRVAIENAEMPDKMREALLRKLDELAAELLEQRLSLGRAMLTLSTVLALASSALADAPDALRTVKSSVSAITAIIGADKVAEDQEADRLGAPPPRLSITDQTARAECRPFDADLDDDVPF